MSYQKGLKSVLALIDPEYPHSIEANKLVENESFLKSAIRLAKDNGLYYPFLLKLKELNLSLSFMKKDLDREEQRLDRLKKTVLLLNNISRRTGSNHIIIKACTTVVHVPRDVDIFVRSEDKEKICRILEDMGMKRIHSGEVETSLEKEGLMKIDLYTSINYATVNFISDEFLWAAQIEDEIFGVKCPGLNNEANFLLMLIHTLFGHREMTLLDFLHLKSLMNKTALDICGRYAQDRRWGTTFELALKELESLRERTYEQGKAVQFPFLFRRGFILKCLSGVEDLNMTGSTRVFFNLSFTSDWIFHKLKKLPLYSYFSSNFQLVRRLLNSFNYIIREKSGDKKSLQK